MESNTSEKLKKIHAMTAHKHHSHPTLVPPPAPGFLPRQNRVSVSRPRPILRRHFIFGLTSLCAGFAAQAQTTHLIPGDFDTPQAAVAAAVAGDTVEFTAAAAYAGGLELSGKGVTLANTSGGMVRLLGQTFISNMDTAGEVYVFNDITFNGEAGPDQSFFINNAAIDITFNNCTFNSWDGGANYRRGLAMNYDNDGVEHVGAITLNDCTFSRCASAMWGNADAGMFVNFNRCTTDDTNVGFITVELKNLNATFTDCTFMQSPQSGRFLQYDGLVNKDMALSFVGCVFDGQNQCNINIVRGGVPAGFDWAAHKEVINLTDCTVRNFNEDGVHATFGEDDEINIAKCVFENCGRAAIYPNAEVNASGSATITLTGSTFRNNARTIYAWYGVYPVAKERGSVVNATACYMSANAENLRVFRSPADWNFTNCVIDNGRRLVETESPPDGSGEPYPGDRNFTFTHCTLVTNQSDTSMALQGGVGNATEVFSKVTLQNCILKNYSGHAFNGPPQGSVNADTCIIEVTGVIDAGDVDVTVTNQVVGDPLFVTDSTGRDTGDFHLQAGSPAVDAGVDAGVTVDFDGVARPSGAGFDLGAFELTQTHLVPGDFATLEGAFTAAVSRDIIEITDAGDYAGGLNLSGKGVTLTNTSGGVVRLLGHTFISNMDTAGEVYVFNGITFNGEAGPDQSFFINNAAIDITFNNCTFNSWDGGTNYRRGLAINYDNDGVEHTGAITLNDCTFSHCAAAMWGNADAGMVVNFNRCTTDDTNAGFITVELKSLNATFTDCTFTQSPQSGRFYQYDGAINKDMTLSFVGCVFDGQNQCNINILRGGVPAGFDWAAHKEVINLTDCTVRNFNEDGVHANFGKDDEINIVNCLFENNGRAAIYPSAEVNASGSPTITLTGSTFRNNARTIYAWYGAYPVATVRGSVVKATGCYMSANAENLRVFRSPVDWNFTNCVIDNGRRLIETESPPDDSGEPYPGDRDFTFTHCTLVTNQGGPSMALSGGVGNTTEVFSNATLQNCILRSYTGDAFNGPPQGRVVADTCIIEVAGVIDAGDLVVTVTNEVGGDPLFVTESTGRDTGDFQLQADSPAIDAGVGAGVTVDFDGQARPSGAGFDLGAFEFQRAQGPLRVPDDFATPQAAFAAAISGETIEFAAAAAYAGGLDLSGKGVTLTNASGGVVRLLGHTFISNMDTAGEVYVFNGITFNGEAGPDQSFLINNAAIDITFNNCTFNSWDGGTNYRRGLAINYDNDGVEHTGAITLNHCTFSHCAAAMWGNADAGMVVNFNRCTTDDTNAGFITVELKSLNATFTDCTFTQSPQSGRFYQYDGLVNKDMILSFVRCVFDGQNQCNINILRGGAPPGVDWAAHKEVINLTDCIVRNFNEDGVHANFGEDDEINIVNCLFENNGRAAIYPSAEVNASGSPTITLTGSTFRNNARTIYAWYGAYPVVTVRGSVVNASGCYMSARDENLRVFRSPADWNFTNCVIDNGRRLVETESPPDDSGEPYPGDRNFTFAHCTLVTNQGGPSMALAGGVGNTTEVFSNVMLQNCILRSYTGDAFNGPPQGRVVADICIIEVAGVVDAGDVVVTVTNEVAGDPLFVTDSTGAGTGDFHLQTDSPAIDVGVDAGVTVDFNGQARPSGTGFDLGAFELVQTKLHLVPGDFATPQAAVAAAVSGDTIEFTTAADYAGGLDMSGKGLTLTNTSGGVVRLLGHSFISNMDAAGKVYVFNDITFNGEAGPDQSFLINNAAIDITFNNCTFNSWDGGTNYKRGLAINYDNDGVEHTGAITLNDCTFSHCAAAMWGNADAGMVVNFNRCTTDDTNAGFITVELKSLNATFTDCTFTQSQQSGRFYQYDGLVNKDMTLSFVGCVFDGQNQCNINILRGGVLAGFDWAAHKEVINLTDCTVRNFNEDGVHANFGKDDEINIVNCLFENNGRAAIYPSAEVNASGSPTITLTRSTFLNNARTIFAWYGAYPVATVRGSVVNASGCYMSARNENLKVFRSPVDWNFTNCVIDNGRRLIETESPPDDSGEPYPRDRNFTFRHCTLVTNQGGPSMSLQGGVGNATEVFSKVTLQNCILKSYTGDAFNGPPQGSVVADTCIIEVAGAIDAGDVDVTVTNQVMGDPLFVTDSTGADTGLFQLQADSPAIDAGVDAGVTVDFFGLARPSGAGFDLGAFEFGQFSLYIVHIGRQRQTGVVTIDFTSDSGLTYAVQASTNLLDWEVLGEAVIGAAEITSFTDSVFAPDHWAQAFYRVALLGRPLAFVDDFESGANGWEATTTSGDTRWELGTPTATGPAGTNSGRNAWGTNIAGDYTPNAVASLRSPVVDLTGLPRPKLSFSYFVDSTRDLEGGQLRFLDENGELITLREEIFSGTTGGWTPFSMLLPQEVRGRKIIIEFLFLTDENADVGAGWYIDDVTVDQ